MPFLLEEIDIDSELAGCRSALIVPCRFCPAASAAVANDKPYIEFFRRLFKTEPYEQQISTMQSRLEDQGIEPRVFRSNVPHQFVLCMWTERRRQKLRNVATHYDAAVVIGCEAAVETVTGALKPTDCRVIPGMRTEGIMNVIPKFRFPGNIWLQRVGVSRVLH